MNQMNNVNIKIKSAAKFRCKIYEPAFQAVIESYVDPNPRIKEIALKGGGASGKSEFIARIIDFFLDECENDEALVCTYSPMHAANTKTRFKRLLAENGTPYKEYNKLTHTELVFGNNNTITFLSVKAGSYEDTLEKLKTFVTKQKDSLKFVWYEEYTAVINVFKNYEAFIYSSSRIYREMRNNSITFYAWNPPKNKKHPVYEFLKNFKGEVIHSTIYDLPKKWQSEYDLRMAEQLKQTNPLAYRHTILGEDVGQDGLAFIVDESIWTDLADNYVSYHYNTDEGTSNATTFGLHGVTATGEIHFITNFMHSSKVDGRRYAPSAYAAKFKEFEQSIGVDYATLSTDGIYFEEELKAIGYKDARSIHAIKDSVLAYSILNDLILTGRYKIVDRPENMLMYEQLENALTKETEKGLIVDKSAEGTTTDQTKHFHLGDLARYFCLRNQKALVGRRLNNANTSKNI